MKFTTNNSSYSVLRIRYKEKYIEEMVNTKFLGLQIDNHLNWMNHIEQTILKLSRARYNVRLMVHISNINTLKSIYYADFHSIIKHGIIFFGVTLPTVGRFSLYKRKSSKLRPVHNPELHAEVYLNSLRFYLFHENIYILSLMNFTVNNQENFQTNLPIHNINKKNKHHLHTPNANLSCFQKSTFHAGIKIFNNLPHSLTILKNEKAKFKVALRKYLNTHPFSSADEFFYVYG
jgi:hypothetical protein